MSDIGMPDDGLELIREVKAATDESGMHVPAIAITAYGERRQELLHEGFAELVPKPPDPLELCGLIRRYVRPPGHASSER